MIEARASSVVSAVKRITVFMTLLFNHLADWLE